MDMTHRHGGPKQVEIVPPRARSIVCLGLKVYLIMILGTFILSTAAVLLVIALAAARG